MPSSDVQEPAVTFTVNGKPHTVLYRASAEGEPADVSATASLADYLRFHQHAPGTKTMCREGGCGACVVTARIADPATGEPRTLAVNACLAPLHACRDWRVQTVEALGDRRAGYHPAQVRLAQLNGTQCGYCSPGMVMSMYSLLNSKTHVTKADVEQSLDGNICRCTGYRPILDAFKTFGEDADDRLKGMVKDIEETTWCGGGGGAAGAAGACTGTGAAGAAGAAGACTGTGAAGAAGAAGACTGTGAACAGCPRAVSVSPGEAQWRLPTSLKDLLADIKAVPKEETLRLVAGNTSQGVDASLKIGAQSELYISLLKVPELHEVKKSATVATFGAAVSLSRLIEELQSLSSTAGFRHCGAMAHHLLVVANTPVRNMASWAGNLMIKYRLRHFPSDVFLLLIAARAKLIVVDDRGDAMELAVETLNELVMDRKVILSMSLPALDDKYIFKSYKITPRAVSAHAYVNAAFLLPVSGDDMTVREKPTLVFGGISRHFVHATNTEEFLVGKSLLEPATVRGALATLGAEVKPDANPELADGQYRADLTSSLLYKMILHVLGDRVPARLRSGGQDLQRPLNVGSQKYQTDKDLWPVTEPVRKLEAQAQTAGEAEYINDQQPLSEELFGAFVLSTVAKAKLKRVDGSAALALPGVRGFFTAKDVVGSNKFRDEGYAEELFAADKVQYCGQSLALVVADSFEIARRATALVEVEYEQVETPVLTIKQALAQGQKVEPDTAELKTGNAAEAIAAAPRKLTGELQLGGQYHFTMETQTVRVVPCEDDQLTVYSSTQAMLSTQTAVARVVGMPHHKINMVVRRLGGGFGAKLEYSSFVAAAAALAAVKLNKPVRIVLDIEANMEMFGGRLPFLIEYTAGVDDTGVLKGLQMRYLCDVGFESPAATGFAAVSIAQNVYAASNWHLVPGSVKTNLAPNTWCRTPGTPQGIAGIENVMQRIAFELEMDPWEVRKANFFTPATEFVLSKGLGNDHAIFTKMVDEMFSEADITARKSDIRTFNEANRWRKRALTLVPMRYTVHLWAKYPTLVSIYDADGTVAVSTGGIEMGQGLNTKVAQAVAHELGITVDMVSVKPSNNLISPNSSPTGGSIGSEMSCMAALRACQELKSRLQPFRGDDKSWQKVVGDASRAYVNLTAHAESGRQPETYPVFGLTAVELELDVLTGENCLLRVDLYEDAGRVMSPLVDVGQVEGAFVMGMGFFMTERHRFNVETGRRLTNRTWNYYVPTVKDIPRDFRIKFLDNNENSIGVYNSKATGEPPLAMTSVCLFALQEAVFAARRDAGLTEWIQFDGPGTVERAQVACATSPDMFVIA